jgi:hypothetical protein
MHTELKGSLHACKPFSSSRRAKRELESERGPTIDICSILAAAFWSNLQRKENTFFTTFLFEIDCKLEAWTPRVQVLEESLEDARQLDETELQWLKRILLKELIEYANVFSREASNVLLPHCSYNHKIHIDNSKSSKSLRYSPLY